MAILDLSLASPAVDAELDELGNGVLLGVVVVRLHQREHLVVRNNRSLDFSRPATGIS